MLTPAEVSKIIRVGLKKVYRLIQDGEIPSVRMGHRTIIVDIDDVNAYLAKRKSESRYGSN